MADVSQVNLPDGSSYNVKDTVARSTKADRVPAPAEYDPTVTYHSGDICTHEGNIYYCYYSTATGPWDANKWNILPTQQQDYLHSVNPVGVGSFSLNRAIGTTVGPFSFAEGLENNSSGYAAHAEGFHTRASGSSSHAEGNGTYASGNSSHAEGSNTSASNNLTHAEGGNTSAAGIMSHVEGYYTKAKYRCQHVFGEYNVEDPSTETNLNNRGNYVEIVGNGTADNARSNARILDWNGNEVLAGGLKINGTQNVATQVELTQAEYDALVQAGTVDLVNTVYFITDGNANANSASETTYNNASSGLSATNVQNAIDELENGKADISTPIQNLTCPRCAISSFDAYKIQKIGNIIFFSVKLTFGATSETGGAYFLSSLVDTADFVQGSLFDDIGDKIYEIGKGQTPSLWIKDSASTLPASSLVNKTRMFLNLIIVKAT